MKHEARDEAIGYDDVYEGLVEGDPPLTHEFDDILVDVPLPEDPPRVGLGHNPGWPCRTCGQLHAYLTAACVPVIWTEQFPLPARYRLVEPPHGLHAVIYTREGETRAIIVWRVPRER